MFLLLIYLFISIFFSFLCSILEAVLLSVTQTYVGVKIKEGDPVGQKLKVLKDDIDKPLAAILTLNTFAHTIGAAGVGAQAQAIWGEQYLSIVSGVLTLIILFVSEIIPKTIGATYWKGLATISATLLIWMTKVLKPFVWVSQKITTILKKDKKESGLSRKDFAVLTDISIEKGIFTKTEGDLLKSLFRLKEITVETAMTPDTVIAAVPETTTIEDLYDNYKNNPEKKFFSRIPIYTKNQDDIHSYVLKDKLLQEIINENGHKTLNDIKRPISGVYEDDTLFQAMEKLIGADEHIALVVDKYGGTEGILTLEDIVETFIRTEIADESDTNLDMQKVAEEKWEARAEVLGLKVLPEVPPITPTPPKKD